MPAQLQRRLTVFLVILAVVALAFLARWYFVGRFVESTDNAYVQGEITRIASQLGARVDEVLVQDNQHVEKGQLLVKLEAADFQLALDRAKATLATREAELEQARSKLKGQTSMIAASAADVNASQATLGRTEVDLGRAQALRKPGYVSEERVTTLAADSNVARSQVAKAQADLQAQRVQRETLGTDVQRLLAQIESARADITQAEINLARTEIHAPVSGLVGQRGARVGQYVQVGSQLLSLVPDDGIWVQANFKETQIGRMRPGQTVRLVFDSFPDQPIEGQLQSLFAASGAQFSLLPPDNATGNFTKVVQRIPVKITFANDTPLQGLIRPGMSVEAEVELRGR
ncbi:membrane fusion protein (multidrug efflux system) [Pseudomonas nitritireducens]|uniref:Membrane fusion protein (Multidrug efflux system) n=1 Tax=Pseudomonas nitroreducens TaxID=46680 RepID=A0A7W7KJM9_PSENT|nr:HlyD family secretion protein [Pseudomonas nitritireducens]MBB4863671.1 membrane fusion protein (multidrug efflux system) [Pseudomonas nitritireducens]